MDEDVESVLHDPRYSARRTGGWVMRGSNDKRKELCPFQRLFSQAMLFLDAPDHTRLRQVLNAGFRPNALRAFKGTIEQMTTGLMEQLAGAEEFDFMESIARPLPAMVIARLLGMGSENQRDFLSWSKHLANFIGAPNPDTVLKRRAQASLLAMASAFESMLARRRWQDGKSSQPEQRDLIGHLLYAEAQGSIEAGAELLAQCAMLLFAGHETTRNLLGNGTTSQRAPRIVGLREPCPVHGPSGRQGHDAARPATAARRSGRCADRCCQR